MNKLNDLELAEFKRQSILRANREVEGFVGHNTVLLKETVDELCIALNKKDNAVAGKLSYRVSTMAPLYDRSDVTNMADFLCKVLKNDDFSGVYEVYKLFSDNFTELMTVKMVEPEMEQRILIKTRETLAKLKK